ncbi:hypothetical protein HNP84_006233 [Thermocatellispora tengchongensis]|uniref:Squalene cyclase C-terminal domain-containing protein n=1 Tax=Thermocatellispora tengchongensis TaxID=1073253 RepID=A0A840PCR3_9ACTN|nr:prenyltransferase/squalene oxidase repeat-containing protein [Thermocatellispora tengchongensis]MBB5136486.1 hypothetical protein [Thermocatellispora tengchongensis]
MTTLGTANSVDVAGRAARLVAELAAEPWGRVSPSVYETGRLVTLAPWLTGHGERIGYLTGAQRADGGWGGPGGYALVPTLSAVEALLSESRRPGSPHAGAVAGAVHRGLETVFGYLRGPRAMTAAELPDMPAIELIVSSLTARINAHLAALAEDPAPAAGLGRWAGAGPLEPPPGVDASGVLAALRARLAAGEPVPEKLLHALEVAGEAAAGAAGAPLTPIGSVGASPAATAAWLAGRGPAEPRHPARRHLESVVRRHGGPVPCGIPVTLFERGWVLSTLARAGVPLRVPEHLRWSLGAACDPLGTPAGPGLPPDADTTSVALYALALLGLPYEPASLWPYEMETHFCTWPGEQGQSLTVNAHVLDAFGRYAAVAPDAAPRYRAAMAKVAGWLRERQAADGSWADRWHASPYYATACCALALAEYGGAASRPAVAAAVRWVLETQREDGSWGRWSGTREETAYAMQVLLLTGAPAPRNAAAARRGYAYLMETALMETALMDTASMDTASMETAPKGTVGVLQDPPLWHDKDLYAPSAIVGAAVLSAIHAARRNRL